MDSAPYEPNKRVSLQLLSNNSSDQRRWVYERRWGGGRRANDSQDSASSSISTASAMSTSPPTDKSNCRARDTANLPGNKLGDPRFREISWGNRGGWRVGVQTARAAAGKSQDRQDPGSYTQDRMSQRRESIGIMRAMRAHFEVRV